MDESMNLVLAISPVRVGLSPSDVLASCILTGEPNFFRR